MTRKSKDLRLLIKKTKVYSTKNTKKEEKYILIQGKHTHLAYQQGSGILMRKEGSK